MCSARPARRALGTGGQQLATNMKAAVIYEYGSPEVFRIEEIDKPSINNDEILIKVKAASVNPVDWKQRQGWHRFFLKAHFPVVLGYDVAGEIEECGLNISPFKALSR